MSESENTFEEEVKQESEEKKDFLMIKEVIDGHFNSIEKLVRYSKSKDDNVLALSKQVQEYRDGFAKNTFKKMALELVSFREDCRKTLRDLTDSILPRETVAKHLGFLSDDFLDLMQNIGLEQKEDTYLFNGKPIDGGLSDVEFKEPEEIPEIGTDELNAIEVSDFESLSLYLKKAEEIIIAILRNNAVLDSLLASYIKAASVYEKGLYQIVLYPTIRKLVDVYDALVKRIREAGESDSDEAMNDTYRSILAFIIDSFEELLVSLDVTICKDYQDVYDPKTDRILKRIPTDNPEFDGKIADRLTDCYLMDEKVISPAKVDIYKTATN